MVRALICLTMVALAGCSAAAGGAGQDALPDFELGDDPELDADVAAITTASNDARQCVGVQVQLDDSEVLEGLKQAYAADPSLAPTFPEFVDSIVAPEQARADEVCNTTLANASDELSGLIQRLTDALDQGAECRGEPGGASNEDSLQRLGVEYLGQFIFSFDDLADFARTYVPEVEALAEQACGG